jgi:CBS domain-containing protein
MNPKGSKARDLCTETVVTVDAEQRPSDVVQALNDADATHCAVFDRLRGFVGIVRLREAATKSTNRIFADLVLQPEPLDVNEALDAHIVLKLIEARGSHELLVLSAKRQYVGLITRQSALTWRLAQC